MGRTTALLGLLVHETTTLLNRLVWRQQLAVITCILLFGATAVFADLSEGLVAHYPLDGSGINALGTGNDGTLIGVIAASDRLGNAAGACYFNGSAVIDMPSGPPINPTSSITYAFWLMSTYDGQYISSNPSAWHWVWWVDRTLETGPLFSLALVTEPYGQFWFLPRTDDWSYSGTLIGGQLTPEMWQHIVMVRDYGTAFRLYVDGVQVAADGDNGRPLTLPPIRLGKHAWNADMGFIGAMDDLRIYNRALSESEVQQLVLPANQPPVAKCKDVTVSAGPDCSADASVDDGSFDPDTGDTFTLSQAPPGPYPLGATVVVLTVTDSHGASDSCTATVTVVDTNPPSITAPAAKTERTDAGKCEVSNVELGTAVATDNCGVASLVNNAPAVFPKGVTTVTWTATDTSGNQSTATQTVTVEDHESPTITAPADILIASDAGSCRATTVALGSPTTADNCDVASVGNDHPSTTFPLGETLVTWAVSDSSANAATAVQKVTVLASVGATFLPPLAGQPVANKIRHGQVVPHKVTLSDCSGAAVTAGVTVKLKVQGIDSADGSVFQDVLEDATGVGSDGTVTSDGIMVLTDGKYQFNLDTSNFGDPNTLAGPTRYYRSTVTVTDNATLVVLGTVSVNLETRD